MYKKLFAIALVAHILVFAYFGLRQGDTSDTITPIDDGVTSDDESLVENDSLADSSSDDFLEEVDPKVEITLVQDFSEALFDVLPASIQSDDLKSGILYDYSQDRVLWEKKSDEPVQIASMTKMMTALLAFEDEESLENISMDTVIQVTDAAFKIGGSQVWLDPRESFSLKELLISIMVKSANDSSYLVGEYLADGSMNHFVERMNERAIELNMNDTHFFNAHGLPEGKTGNTASCQDLVRLAVAMMRFDLALEWASIPSYDFRADSETPTVLANHNRLILTTKGVDGLKTGYTKGAGFCVTATVIRDGRRLIAVTTGFQTSKRRNTFTKNLIEWGYKTVSDSDQSLASN